MFKKIILALLFVCLVGSVFGSMPNGYVASATCGNNVCEKMYVEIAPVAEMTVQINEKDILIKSETEGEVKPLTSFSFNGIKDRPGGAAKGINNQLKEQLGFSVNSIEGEYNEAQIPSLFKIYIEEDKYCLSDCMKGIDKVSVVEGWNLINEDSLTAIRLSQLNSKFNYESDFVAIYSYYPILNQYFREKPRIDYTSTVKDFISNYSEAYAELVFGQQGKALWVYSNYSGDLYHKSESIDKIAIQEVNLFKGWNLMVTPKPIYANLWNECSVQKIYFWFEEDQKWYDVLKEEDEKLEDVLNSNNFVGRGMAVKIVEDCVLNKIILEETKIPSVPTIPE